MVLIENLKDQILQNHIPPLLVFVCKENFFLAYHYVNQIAKRTEKPLIRVDEIADLQNTNLFNNLHDTNTVVFECDVLKSLPADISGYIICSKIDASSNVEDVGDVVCELPVLEKWQLKDYLYSKCEGADVADLDYLFELFGKDPFQLEIEMSKITIFSPAERKYVLPIFIRDNIFGSVNSDTIFTLTNALCVKDVQKVASVLEHIDQIDVEPLGLVTLMVNNVRNMLLIQGSPTATAEKVGMSAKQFYAISKNLGHFTTQQLIHILKVLTQIDLKLKTGELPAEWIIPRVITLILSEQ